MSSIVVKFPTRARPEKFFRALGKYVEMASGKHSILYIVTCDVDDEKMNTPAVHKRLDEVAGLVYRFGHSRTKIEAINADMDLAGDDWDILVVASDDMVPCRKGWDDRIAVEMQERESVWFFDGRQKRICTLTIMSRKRWLHYGYIYHPDYVSLWCDNEYTDVEKPHFVDEEIISHHLPSLRERDELCDRNNAYWNQDEATYRRRKLAGFPPGGVDIDDSRRAEHPALSVLICSLRSRSQMLARLLNELDSQIERHSLGERVEVLVAVDEKQASIGGKRNQLLHRANGEYVCYVDDDDMVSGDFLRLLVDACGKGSDCVCYKTKVLKKRNRAPTWVTVTHSLKYRSWTNAGGEDFLPPVHHCPIRRKIAELYEFPDISFGEDYEVSMAMASDNAIKTETLVDEILYYKTPSGMVHETGAQNRDGLQIAARSRKAVKQAIAGASQKKRPVGTVHIREAEPKIPTKYQNAILARNKRSAKVAAPQVAEESRRQEQPVQANIPPAKVRRTPREVDR